MKIDNTQWNSKCRLYGVRDKTINHISECRKLVQRAYKTRHDWMGKMIHSELCKKLKFNHIAKLYMHKLKSLLENEMYEILWDFKIKTNLILARRLDPVIINKENLLYNGFWHPSGPLRENQRKWKERQVLMLDIDSKTSLTLVNRALEVRPWLNKNNRNNAPGT